MNRRSFLATVAAGLAAPAIVRAESLMRLARPARYAMAGGVLAPIADREFSMQWISTAADGSRTIITVPRLRVVDHERFVDENGVLHHETWRVQAIRDEAPAIFGDFAPGRVRVSCQFATTAFNAEAFREVFGPLASDVADIERRVVLLPAHHAME